MYVRFLSIILSLAVFTTSALAQPRTPEMVFWESVRSTEDPAELEAYLQAYPSGTFSALAHIRLEKLQPAAAVEITNQPLADATSGIARRKSLSVVLGRTKGGKEAWLGVQIIGVTDEIATALALQEQRGIVVANIAPSSPAFEAGIHPGDVILKVDGQSITAPDDLPRIIASMSPGQWADVLVWRTAPTFDDLLDRFYSRAERGDAGAMAMLGFIYREGFGIAKNQIEAVRWYRHAADEGHAAAMAFLGWAYANGKGIAKDETQAVRWYRKAADNGHAPAMNNLGVSYASGNGVAKDAAEAVRWFRKAADNGYTDAFFSLGWRYDKGLGVIRDSRVAARNVFDALRRGSKFATEQLTTNATVWSKPFRRELQRLMVEAGVYDGSIDGAFGPETRAAIRALAENSNTGRNQVPKAKALDIPMVVAIPELNVFSQPDVISKLIGTLQSGDRVVVEQWQDNLLGEKWAKICADRICGWVGAEFLEVAPSGADGDVFVDLPELPELEKLELIR